MENIYTQVWNNAYDIYNEGDYYLMWDYLREQINNGNITQDDAEMLAEDMVEAFDEE